jgi:hypothetical protein
MELRLNATHQTVDEMHEDSHDQKTSSTDQHIETPVDLLFELVWHPTLLAL